MSQAGPINLEKRIDASPIISTCRGTGPMSPQVQGA
jgi:hypothetical protein